MRSPIPILVLVAASVCALPAPVDAQSRQAPEATAAKSTKAHAASLLKIAQELRKAGQTDVAAKIEAQARRLMASRLPFIDRRQRIGVPEGGGVKAKSKSKRAPRAARSGRWSDESDAAPKSIRTKAEGRTERTSTGVRAWVRARTAPRAEAAPDPVKAPRGRPRPPRPAGAEALPAPDPAGRVRNLRAPRPMVAPKGKRDDFVEIPKVGPPGADDARIDKGRNRYRYAPVPTGRDAKGRVTWRGLPPRSDSRPPDVPRPDLDLERRVEALSKEVRAMRATLEKLSEHLARDRRKRLIR